MKLNRLKRKVGVELVGLCSFFIILLIIYLFVDNYESTLAMELKNKKNAILALNQSVTKIEDDLRKATNSAALYQKLRASKYTSDSLTREAAKNAFDSLQKKYDLINVKVKIKPIEAMKAPSFNNATVQLEYSLVELDVSAISDESILGFSDSLRTELPGLIHFNNISIQRKGLINEGTLALVRSGEVPELATGRISFYWLGFKHLNPDAKNQNSEQKL